MTRPPCPICSTPMMSNGRTKAGNPRYRCKCGHTLTQSDHPWGSLPQGDKPLTDAERYQRWKEANPEEAKRQNREKQRRYREKKRKEEC